MNVPPTGEVQMKIIRQGDVLLVPSKLPEGCEDITPTGDIILAFGEVTGHAHRIADWKDSGRLARNAIHQARARLLRSKDGTRFLEVLKPVTLRHEEHSPATIAPGVYEIPEQMEHSAARMRRVED